MLKLGEVLFKYRDYTPLPFIIVMLWKAQANQQSLMIGGALMIVGELIRIYGVAYIGGVSRTRSYSTGQKIISGGPFAYVRNPLYVGNLLLSSGLIVVANVELQFAHDFLLIFVAIFFAQYIPVVAWEENNLATKFGESYETYRSQVPRWIPRIRPAQTQGVAEEINGDYKMALKSEKNTLGSAIILVTAILWRSGLLSNIGL